MVDYIKTFPKEENNENLNEKKLRKEIKKNQKKF